MGFGKQLKKLLDELDVSVSALSRETGIKQTTLYSMIDRDTDSVGLDKVRKIEKALHIIPGSTMYNMLYDIDVEDPIVSTRQLDWYSVGPETREYFLIENYHKLNSKGQAKAAEYIEDLTKINDYTNT